MKRVKCVSYLPIFPRRIINAYQIPPKIGPTNPRIIYQMTRARYFLPQIFWDNGQMGVDTRCLPGAFHRAPFLVGSCFIQNIGMWGVQIVATEFSDDFTQLQLYLNHPVGETVQIIIWGPIIGQKCPLRGPWECQNGMKASKKEEPTQISIWRSFKLLFSLSDHCQVFKGSKYKVQPGRVFCAVLVTPGVSWGAQKLFSQLGSV